MVSKRYTPTEAQDLKEGDEIIFFDYDSNKPFTITNIAKGTDQFITFEAKEKHDFFIAAWEFTQLSRVTIQFTYPETAKLMKYEEPYSDENITLSNDTVKSTH